MHTIKRRSEEKAYLKGYRAGINGRSDFLCPYKTNINAREKWLGGWREGREQLIMSGDIVEITKH